MKGLFIILTISTLLFTSCLSEPYADFTANKRVVEIGESFTSQIDRLTHATVMGV
jgi:hypothetical protein